jgi:hypothetical protein
LIGNSLVCLEVPLCGMTSVAAQPLRIYPHNSSPGSANAPLSPPSTAGVFISYHTQVQQPSVFDCQRIAAGCAPDSARQGTSQGAAQVVWSVSDGKSPAPADKT